MMLGRRLLFPSYHHDVVAPRHNGGPVLSARSVAAPTTQLHKNCHIYPLILGQFFAHVDIYNVFQQDASDILDPPFLLTHTKTAVTRTTKYNLKRRR